MVHTFAGASINPQASQATASFCTLHLQSHVAAVQCTHSTKGVSGLITARILGKGSRTSLEWPHPRTQTHTLNTVLLTAARVVCLLAALGSWVHHWYMMDG